MNLGANNVPIAERLGGLMPKIRVHELAKELNLSNKELIEKMGESGQGKTGLSTLDDNDVSRLRGEQKKDIPVGEGGKPSRPLGTDGKPRTRPPRPVGADGKPLPPRPRPVGADGKPLPRPPRPVGPDGKPLPRPSRPTRADEKSVSTRPSNSTPPTPPPLGVLSDDSGIAKPIVPPPEEPRQKNTEQENNSRPQGQGDRPPRRDKGQGQGTYNRPPRDNANRSQGQGGQGSYNRPPRDPNRPQGDRPPRDPNRPQGERRPYDPNRPQGERRPYDPNRPQGERRPYDPNRPQGERRPYDPNRPQGERRPYDPNRPQGDRPPRDPNRPQGERRPYDPNRPQGQGGGYGRPQGGGGRPQTGGAGGARSGGFGKPAGGAKPGASGGRTDVKKTEPTKDDKRQQWRNQQIHSAKNKDDKRKDKENRQALDRRGGKKPVTKKLMPKREQPTVTVITVAPEITVRDLSEKLLRSNAEVIKVLMKKGIMVTANQTIDFEAATYVAESFDVLVEEYVEVDVFAEAFDAVPDDESSLEARPPVVVVMGHVDHGKTSLLDVIRKSNVQKSEAGGITQHIGAYNVTINDKKITFLDTPGHEAFTAMRMRGAQVTDIAILVVAANDGVMPQTIEAINHAKAAGVEIVVAITMIDKPDANPDKVKQQLAQHGLQSEDWGGTTITVPVSARENINIDQLLEMILLVAEMKELRANPNKPAKGSIIEAKLDKGRGPVATVLVQEGTLRVGDPIVAGACYGKVRAMTNSRGKSVKEAGPSIPVEIIGLAEVPTTGDILYTAQNEKQARQLSASVVAKGRVNMIKSTQGKVSLDDLFSQIQAGQVKDLNIVIKADVQGSVEALRGSLEKLTNDEVRVRIIHTGAGAVTESDVMLASASNAIIIGFNVRPEPVAKSVAESENVDVRFYSVIYSAIDDIQAAMKGMLDPEFAEKIIGHAEIRQIFKASGIGIIGGCYVTEGKITRNAQVRIVRDGRVVYDGTLDTLRRFKDDAREVASGYECGMLFKNFSDIKENDKVEAYIMEEIPR